MAFKSAWSRGLWYGAIFGGTMALFPVIAALFGNAPVGEIALAGGTIAVIWGGFGFLAGFSSHSEQRSDAAGNPVQQVQISLFRRLLYRFVAGLFLSYIAGMIVMSLAIYAAWQVDLFEPVNRRITDDERVLIFVGMCGTNAAVSGTVAGCWLGALLSPGGNVLGPIAKSALVTALFGALASGWLGALIGLVCFQCIGFGPVGAIAAASAGVLVGIAIAIVLRLFAFR